MVEWIERQLLRRKVVVATVTAFQAPETSPTTRQFKLDITGAKREKKKNPAMRKSIWEEKYLWSVATGAKRPRLEKRTSIFGAQRLERSDQVSKGS